MDHSRLTAAFGQHMFNRFVRYPKPENHPEEIGRLEALWRAWESLRLDGTTGMSVWWRVHADHHMSVLLSADSPFKGCSPDDGHKSKLRPLPCQEPSEGLFS